VTIHRIGSYAADYKLTALTEVTGKTRTMPSAFISANGTDVTDEFRLYLRPLLGSGMPEAHRLYSNPVQKILNV
jgi:6-phosphofructokinase 1